MESLFEKQQQLLARTNLKFKRYMFGKIPWESRMVGLTGPRGVGKTTMLLQYIKEQNNHNILYVSADDLYFSNHRLTDLADEFYKNGGKHFFIDEVHKYKDWSVELKNMYDFYPDLKICFTGSSILDIRKGMADLSRRALMFTMQGFSFREYLKFEHDIDVPVHSFKQIISNQISLIDKLEHPLPVFRDYLQKGYYPVSAEDNMDIRLGQILNLTLEVDIPQFANLSVTTARKLKKLLVIVAESVPFKPNFSSIATALVASRNNIADYCDFIEDAGMIIQVHSDTGGLRGLGKVDKIYLENPNLVYALASDNANTGNVRETFFLNQMRVKHKVFTPATGDFKVQDFVFEIGGKNKKQKQIIDIPNAFVVKDDIEFGFNNVIPLWHFGLTY